MSERIKRYFNWRWAALVAAVGMCAVLLPADDARGVGMAQVMTEKSLPEATVAVIDPETGSSSGTGGSDVRIAVGDVILFRFAVSPVPDKRNRGMQTYLTEYVPPGTEVVGVRIIDASGNTIKPRYPGLAHDGCSGGSDCNDFDDLPCSTGSARAGEATVCSGGQRSFTGGTIAGLHGDTGVFYSNDPLTARTPNNVFLSPTNGIQMSPQPSGISPDLTPLLGYTAPFFAHNAWDWDQVQAYGVSSDTSGSGGDGNAPFLYASPVAGPDTFYRYQATDNGGSIQFNDEVGPWNRIVYPGSRIGGGGCRSNNSEGLSCAVEATDNNFVRHSTPTMAGTDVTPNNPVTANAIRFALGQSRTGEPVFVEVALRVTSVPIDPNFGSMGDNVNCGEIFGAGLSARGTGQDGAHHPWATYIASPQCVFLRTLLDIDVDKDLAVGENVTYDIRAKNLSLNTETNVVVYQQFDSTRISFVSATPPADGAPTACPAGLDTSKQCLRWTIGTMAPSDENLFQTTFTTGGGGGTSAVTQAVFSSDAQPLPGFQTNALTIITGIARPTATLAPSWTVTSAFASANTSAQLTGTLSNSGTEGFSFDRIILSLPTAPVDWTVNGSINLGGTSYPCTANCASANPEFDIPESFSTGQSKALTVDLNVPAGTSDGLYEIGLHIWGTQSGFGGDYETALPALATVNVGQVRTAKPVLTCPIGSTSTTIDGTATAGADIKVFFNLMERQDNPCVASGGAFSCTFAGFGSMYGGLEVRASARATGELESELADPCEVTPKRECSDGIDNDGDGFIDFPGDPGCDSPTDSSENTESSFECSDRVDNDSPADGDIDWPDDASCYGPTDPTETGNPACSDGIDNDGDGLTDAAEETTDCVDGNDPTEQAMPACMDRVDNDGDGNTDFPDDPGCHSAIDNDETDLGFTPADTKPRILIVFDTSGSMNWNTCIEEFTDGDGSVDCSGSDVACSALPMGCSGGSALTCDNGQPDDSRLFKVKDGVSNVIAGFGEVEWGLMRFTQRAADFQCPGSNAGLRSGGWQGGGLAPCSAFNGGDVVVGFSPDNQQSLLTWMDNETNYPGGGDPPFQLDLELRGTGTTPLGGALSDAQTYLAGVQGSDSRSACRPYRVILVTDGEETCGGDPVASAAALRSAGYFVSVIGFATTDAGVVAQLNSIANAGSQSGTDPAVFVDDAASLSSAIATIVSDSILTEICNDLDDDCDGKFDEGFPDKGNACDNGQAGVCFDTGTFVCASDGLSTECNAPDGSGNSTTEVCNNVDDDCDGKIDEGLTCNCVPEVCNGIDDDCDSNIDEAPLPGVGTQCGIDIGLCEFGSIQCVDPDSNAGTANSRLECTGGVNPAPSDPCDGDDNDCDTLTDEDAGNTECYPSATAGCTPNGSGGFNCLGICSPGASACTMGVPGSCMGATTPGTETCNGIDDDCDGTVDENWMPDTNGNVLGATCDNGGVGACNATGVYACDVSDPGGPLVCTAPTISPTAEVCNGLDDDCDNDIDETGPAPPDGLGPPIGDSCGTAGCTPGVLTCVDPDMDPATPNSEIQCVGQMGGMAEICNGADDDCDTAIDEEVAGVGVQCYPSGTQGCTDNGNGTFSCEGQCQPGTTICSPPSILCDGHVGPAAEDTCDGVDNDCDGNIDEMAQCPNMGDICLDGECVFPCDNTEFPCPFGFFCETLADTTCSDPPCRFCRADPCVNITCNAGEICNSQTGACEDPCDGVNCRTGETCSFGSCFDCFDAGFGCAGGCEVCVANNDGVGICQTDACCGVMCGDGEFCQDGNCVPLTCDPACPTGEICRNGTCETDRCADVTCSGAQVCDPTDGMCKGDRCAGRVCPQGQACEPSTGDCISDPCATVTCPADTMCEVGFGGAPTCVPRDDGGYNVFAGGSGGCLSATNGTGSAPLLILLAALLAARRRRSND